MLRVIFDTNIYGKLIEEKYFEEISTKIKEDKEFKVYGSQIIRKELRDTPKTSKLGKLNKRNLLLNFSDIFNSAIINKTYKNVLNFHTHLI